MATEIAIFTLLEGSTPGDLTTDAGKQMLQTLDTVLKQKGAQRAYWGVVHENPQTLRLFIDWDSVDAHKTFMKSDIYKPFVEDFGKVADLSSGQVYHVILKPFPPKDALSTRVSPATELLNIYFPSNYSVADQDKFDEDFRKLMTVIEKTAEGAYTGSAGGWVVEEQELPGKTEQCKVYFGAIGWKSVEHHLAFRNTPAFKENIHLLRGAKELKHLEVVHYHGEEVDAKV